jgi:hypothetical protein
MDSGGLGIDQAVSRVAGRILIGGSGVLGVGELLAKGGLLVRNSYCWPADFEGFPTLLLKR